MVFQSYQNYILQNFNGNTFYLHNTSRVIWNGAVCGIMMISSMFTSAATILFSELSHEKKDSTAVCIYICYFMEVRQLWNFAFSNTSEYWQSFTHSYCCHKGSNGRRWLNVLCALEPNDNSRITLLRIKKAYMELRTN